MSKVYISVNENNEVTKVFSDVFEVPSENDILIDEGIGDKYVHVTSRYNLQDDYGRYNYKFENNEVVQIPEKDKPPIPAPTKSEFEILKETVDMLVISTLRGE